MEATGPIKILIADDEYLARKRIETSLQEVSFPVTLYQASNGKKAIEIILEEAPELVFLDIKMTDMTGFDVLRQLPKELIPEIIFVTAFDAFAVEAFEVQAIDFLLKPYKKSRLMEALERGIQRVRQKENNGFQLKLDRLINYVSRNTTSYGYGEPEYLERIVLKTNKKYIFVETESIQYIKASGYYAEIYTEIGQKHVYRISMTEMSIKLNPSVFSRVNRSAIVNINFIKEIISEGQGDYSIVMLDRTSFPLSKSQKGAFLDKMGIRQ